MTGFLKFIGGIMVLIVSVMLSCTAFILAYTQVQLYSLNQIGLMQFLVGMFVCVSDCALVAYLVHRAIEMFRESKS